MRYADGKPYAFSAELMHRGGMPVQVIRFDNRMEVLSSAIVGGGRSQTSTVMIMEVPKDYPGTDPVADAERVRDGLGLPEDTVCLMTAAEVEYVFNVAHHEYGGAEGYAAVTAGLSNQVVAGEVLEDWESRHALSLERSARMRHAGTINTVAVSSVALDDAGLVNAVICVTEAKTAAMNAIGYRETGTTSDAVAVLCPPGGRCSYAGTASDVGIAMARSVRDGVARALIVRDDFPEGTEDGVKRSIRERFGV